MNIKEIRQRVKACVDNSNLALALSKLPNVETELLAENLRNVITEADRALELIDSEDKKPCVNLTAYVDTISEEAKRELESKGEIILYASGKITTVRPVSESLELWYFGCKFRTVATSIDGSVLMIDNAD